MFNMLDYSIPTDLEPRRDGLSVRILCPRWLEDSDDLISVQDLNPTIFD